MDAQQAASMMAMMLNGVTKERAAAHFGHDPGFDKLWDDTASYVEQRRKEVPDIEFDIPNEMPDLEGIGEPPTKGDGDGKDAESRSEDSAEGDGDGPDAENPAEDAAEKTAPDGPAVANLKKKAAPPK